jgi:hypothetical protein
MAARPHFYPALQNNIALYKDNVKKALREEWESIYKQH